MGPDLVGYTASGLVLLTFTAKSMLTLRILAILSNFAFICYGLVDSIAPVLCLHAILLPLNITRLAQLLASPSARDRVCGKSAPIVRIQTGQSGRIVGNHSNDRGQEEHMPRPVVRCLRLLARWRERERHRRELATMSVRDFGDIAVPPGLIREEQARWPWQAMNQGWAALSRNKCVPRNGGGCSGQS